MSTANRYYSGTTVSRYLSPNGRAWAGVVYQSGKPVLDSELLLDQDAAQLQQGILTNTTLPSGWVNTQGAQDFVAVTPGSALNALGLQAATVRVAGYAIQLAYANTNSASMNVILLDDPPILGGTSPDVKRTDFVFLEMWLAQVAPSPRASGTVAVLPALPTAGDTIEIDGNVLTAVAGAPATDEFTIGADEYTTAANIATAINDPGNSFSTVVSASAGGSDTVTIKAVDPGTVGNTITLAATGVALAASGATLAGGADRPNKPSQSTVYRNGCVQAPSAANLADDIADPVIDSESTQRVQIQWRLRVTGQAEAVNFKTQPLGFENTAILAQGGESAPVSGYQFVPADGSTIAGSSSATAYGQVDSGLWVAGDGSSSAASDLGTVDGFVYTVPVAMVFRRNDAYQSGAGDGFDPLNNTNGALPYDHALFVNPAVGSIPANTSDRPDGLFCDVIAVPDDVLDLRRSVSPQGISLDAELSRQVQALLDGRNRTWAVDGADRATLGAGSGDVSTRFLVCDQIGRATSKGGVVPAAGDTTRGSTVRNWDHVARRFGQNPVVERFVMEVYPGYTPAPSATDPVGHQGCYNTQAVAGRTKWTAGDMIVLDLDALNASSIGNFDPATNTFVAANVMYMAPTGTIITDVISLYHDDGHYTTAVPQQVIPRLITGLGTSTVTITLDTNTYVVNGGDSGNPDYQMAGTSGSNVGSPRRIFLEVEITYPAGPNGLTFTPDLPALSPDSGVYPVGAILENDTAQRPADFEALLPAQFRQGSREVKLEYVANDGSSAAITDTIVSRTTLGLALPRRVYGGATLPVTVTDDVDALARLVKVAGTEYGSSSRLVVLDGAGPNGPLSGAQTLCTVTYYAQDPLPNYGADGYQVGLYYRSVAPATAGVQPGGMGVIPDPATFQLLAVSGSTWTLVAGAGSNESTFPYANPMDFIPVNDAGATLGSWPSEWYFQGSAQTTVADFSADAGMLRLHSFIQADMGSPIILSGKTKDAENRALYTAAATAGGYRPSSAAQPLSGVTRHKAFTAALARSQEDTALFRRGEVLLLVFSEYLELSDINAVLFPETSSTSCVSVYRTSNLLILP